jgi:hypothetical protein
MEWELPAVTYHPNLAVLYRWVAFYIPDARVTIWGGPWDIAEVRVESDDLVYRMAVAEYHLSHPDMLRPWSERLGEYWRKSGGA